MCIQVHSAGGARVSGGEGAGVCVYRSIARVG